MSQKPPNRLSQADSLRTPETLLLPDPRMAYGDSCANLTQIHARLEKLQLHEAIPESIRIHFETAKNLLLYAWCVYRFHMVAQGHAFSTLEMALRERMKELDLVPSGRARPRGLANWMRLAAKHSVITNARFGPGEAVARHRAEARYEAEVHTKMQAEGLTSVLYDLADAEVCAEDHSDWIEHYAQHLPTLRNLHAHGTEMLYAEVHQSFVVVAAFVNQCWPRADGVGEEGAIAGGGAAAKGT